MAAKPLIRGRPPAEREGRKRKAPDCMDKERDDRIDDAEIV
jgi:hypothetical protein